MILDKIQKLETISTTDIEIALADKPCNKGLELYAILCAKHIKSDLLPRPTEETLRKYASDVIKNIEIATGQTYNIETKAVVTEFFILDYKCDYTCIEKCILEYTNAINTYKNCVGGTLEWFLIEDIKRQLMFIYISKPIYLDSLKKLIKELINTEEMYLNYIQKIYV